MTEEQLLREIFDRALDGNDIYYVDADLIRAESGITAQSLIAQGLIERVPEKDRQFGERKLLAVRITFEGAEVCRKATLDE